MVATESKTPVWASWRWWRFARLKFTNWRRPDGRRSRWIEAPGRWVHVVGPLYFLWNAGVRPWGLNGPTDDI
jgi:ribosomal protein L32E